MRRALLLTLCMILLLTSTAAKGLGDSSTLAVPYSSYTYDFWQEPVYAPQAYVPVKTIRGMDLGVGAFSSPRDIFVDAEKSIYISDTGNNRIIQLNSDYEVIRIFSEFVNNGVIDCFNTPRGIYVTDNGHIYIADRNNSRIVVLDQKGQLVQMVGPPQPEFSGVIRADFRYNPNRIGVDNVGRIFVVSDEVYDGILEFDPQGDFCGFIGAPRVTPSLIDYLWRRFSSAERKKLLTLFLPTEHSSIDIDERGFIFATVTDGEIRYTEAIRRLNPAGTDVMRRAGFNPPIGDYGSALLDQYGEATLASSLLVDVIARKNGMYSALDQRRGRVFTYDENGNLLYVFGGLGQSRGTFQIPEAIAELDESILVLDRGTNMITVFNSTDYAQSIHAAIAYYHDDDWDNSVLEWQKVKQMNVNLDVAHTGIGRAQMREDSFAEAMYSFRLGEDRINYSKAFALYRREVIYKNFTMVVILIVVMAAAIFVISKFRLIQKLRYTLEKWGGRLKSYTIAKSLAYALYLIIHPLEGFWDLKHEKRGNAVSAGIILGLLTLSYVYARQYTGFIFNRRDLNKLNIYVEFASILIPFFLWCIVNWSLTTVSDGKGSFKDIFITVAYACTPLIIMNIPLTFISNYIIVEEGSFYYTLTSLGVVWTVILIFIGTMVVHQYDFGKTALFTGLTIAGMGLTLFIGLLYFNLAEQVYQFFSEIYIELVFRN
ncbi:MAG: DUF1282 family protein [Firmicutes bacterium]|nr:DUF1282 family protein [Bacillota bacterium]